MKNLILMAALVLSTVAGATPAKNIKASPLESGKPAPEFSAKGADGKTYKLSDLKGKTVVLEWFNKDCPYVRKYYDAKAMQKLQKEATAKGVVWLTVASSAPGKEGFVDEKAAKEIRAQRDMGNTTILIDSAGSVASLYSAKTTPHMFVIDKKGLLAYQGAIDDKPSANPKSLEGAQNYVAAALLALDKGEPVKNASTTPYGCSVKY
ncbi:MAG: thioredoxin family protein [Bdellovibrionales bacterium]